MLAKCAPLLYFQEVARHACNLTIFVSALVTHMPVERITRQIYKLVLIYPLLIQVWSLMTTFTYKTGSLLENTGLWAFPKTNLSERSGAVLLLSITQEGLQLHLQFLASMHTFKHKTLSTAVNVICNIDFIIFIFKIHMSGG